MCPYVMQSVTFQGFEADSGIRTHGRVVNIDCSRRDYLVVISYLENNLFVKKMAARVYPGVLIVRLPGLNLKIVQIRNCS
jgi:hypothetical protein